MRAPFLSADFLICLFRVSPFFLFVIFAFLRGKFPPASAARPFKIYSNLTKTHRDSFE